jgi:hypothetical protein
MVLGAGVITYFMGPDTFVGRDKAGSGKKSNTIEVELNTVSGFSGKTERVLHMPWGTGAADAVRKGVPTKKATIETVFGSAGYTFVVDHPEGVYGARVRWFSSQGRLVGTRLEPPGSTVFRPDEDGYNFVVAKSGGKSEKAVVVDVATSTETTFAIPLQMNTGGLARSGDTLYASIAPSDVDFETERMYLRNALIPVARGGVQVDDATADSKSLDVWGFGWDGKAYTSVMEVMGLDVTSSEVHVVIGSGGRQVRVPRRYRLLGVAPDSSIYLNTLPPLPTYKRPVQLAAAWNSSHSPFDDVLVIGLNGKIKSRIVIPYSSVLARYDDTLPMSLSKDGLYTVREERGGVSVVVHRFE